MIGKSIEGHLNGAKGLPEKWQSLDFSRVAAAVAGVAQLGRVFRRFRVICRSFTQSGKKELRQRLSDLHVPSFRARRFRHIHQRNMNFDINVIAIFFSLARI